MLTIEIAGNNNDLRLPFRPDKPFRGAFDFAKAGPETLARFYGWPSLPGQRITLDPANNIVEVIEPLNSAEHAELRRKIIDRYKCRLAEDEKLQLTPDQMATWLHWLGNACASGHARIVAGNWPSVVPGTAKLTEFYIERPRDPNAETLQLLKQQNELLAAQNERLVKAIEAIAAKR